MDAYTISIRPRRQATFPAPLLQKLGVGVGDRLQVRFKENQATLKPQKRVALEALVEIQKVFAASGIPENRLQQELVKQRESSA